MWIVSIMPTTYITITALKSTRTLWPSITNSKCHQADTTGRTQADDWHLPRMAAVMVWFVRCSTSEGGQDWIRSCSLGHFPPPALVHRSWGLLWGSVYFRLTHYTSVCETSSHPAFQVYSVFTVSNYSNTNWGNYRTLHFKIISGFSIYFFVCLKCFCTKSNKKEIYKEKNERSLPP